jgi:hypothetical protein
MGKYIIGVGAQIKFRSEGCTPSVMRLCQISYQSYPAVSLIADETDKYSAWIAWNEAVPVQNIRELTFTEVRNLIGFNFPISAFSLKVGARWVKLYDVFAEEMK